MSAKEKAPASHEAKDFSRGAPDTIRTCGLQSRRVHRGYLPLFANVCKVLNCLRFCFIDVRSLSCSFVALVYQIVYQVFTVYRHTK